MDKIESREDYLEAILQLSESGKSVRSIDVANHLGFSRPSVSIAMKKLKQEGLIDVKDNGELILTTRGKDIAEKTLAKHEFLTSWFESLGVSELRAEEIACEIEHSIDQDTFEKMKAKLEKK